MWWGCCRSGSCTALHRFGDVHTPWCWAEGHQLSPVRLERHSLPAGYTAVCVFAGGKHSSIQLNSLHTRVIPLLQQWVVSWPEQMCHWNQTPSLSQDSSGLRASLQGLMHGHLQQQHNPCGYSLYQMLSVPSTQKSAQLLRSICSVYFQVCFSLLPVCIHLPSPFAWKRRGRRRISHTFGTMPPWQQPVTAC